MKLSFCLLGGRSKAAYLTSAFTSLTIAYSVKVFPRKPIQNTQKLK